MLPIKSLSLARTSKTLFSVLFRSFLHVLRICIDKPQAAVDVYRRDRRRHADGADGLRPPRAPGACARRCSVRGLVLSRAHAVRRLVLPRAHAALGAHRCGQRCDMVAHGVVLVPRARGALAVRGRGWGTCHGKHRGKRHGQGLPSSPRACPSGYDPRDAGRGNPGVLACVCPRACPSGYDQRAGGRCSPRVLARLGLYRNRGHEHRDVVGEEAGEG